MQTVQLRYDRDGQVQGRKLSVRELADLSNEWENPTVNTLKYYQSVCQAWEVSNTRPGYVFPIFLKGHSLSFFTAHEA